jgi:hypothetical protein
MRRYLQTSRHQVFIFVEGRDLDPDIYSRICGPVCRQAGKLYEIIIADRIAGGGGGKSILTGLLELLNASGSLLDRSQPEPKLAMFYLDKDVGELFRTLRISDHVVYTRYYQIENHILIEGELVGSIATAGSIDRQLVVARIANSQAWRAQAASCWRDWVALCILAMKLKQQHPVSYRTQSNINDPADAPASPINLQAAIAAMQAQSGLTANAFGRRKDAAYRLVDRFFSRSQHDLLFKGKWYGPHVLRELELVTGGGIYNRNGATDRLWASLITSTNFDGQWVEYFRQPLRAALALL